VPVVAPEAMIVVVRPEFLVLGIKFENNLDVPSGAIIIEAGERKRRDLDSECRRRE
jgi:hypothetical protein